MSIFRVIAGYTYGHADVVRRAISKKKGNVLEAEKDNFLNGAVANGVEKNIAEKLFDDIASFANYAFNKSHAAAYALISYRTAYLKAHYPCEYMAALITSVLGNMTKLAEYIAECGKYGIRVLSPDINESRKIFHAHDGNIVFGLLALKNVGEQFVGSILSERAHGAFSDFEDFVRRMAPYDINKRMVEALIKSGAFDRLGVYRSRLLASYEQLIDIVQEKNRNNLAGQLDMFSMLSAVSDVAPKFTYPALPDFALRDKLLLEKECSGMYFSGHLIDSYSEMIEYLAPDRTSTLAEAEEGDNKKPARVAGIVSGVTKKTTRKNETMVFLQLEDRYGEIECLVFPRQFAQFAHLLRLDAAICVQGNLSVREDEPPKILVSDVQPLLENGVFVPKQQVKERQKPSAPVQGSDPRIDRATTNSSITKLYLRVPSMDCEEYRKARNLVETFAGVARVIFYDASTAQYVKTELGVEASPLVLSKLSAVLGKENVVAK